MLIGIAVSFVGKVCHSSDCVLSVVEVISLQFSLNGNILLPVLKKTKPQKVKTATDKLFISFIVLLMPRLVPTLWYTVLVLFCSAIGFYVTSEQTMPAASQG